MNENIIHSIFSKHYMLSPAIWIAISLLITFISVFFAMKSQKKKLSSICNQIGAKIIHLGFWKGYRGYILKGRWNIYFSFFYNNGDKKNHLIMYSIFDSFDAKDFTLTRKNLFALIFGSKNLQTGEPKIDNNFIASSKEITVVNTLLSDRAMKGIFITFTDKYTGPFSLSVKKRVTSVGLNLKGGKRALCIDIPDIKERNPEAIKDMVELTALTLERLSRMGILSSALSLEGDFSEVTL
jgi:hypothetical protein